MKTISLREFMSETFSEEFLEKAAIEYKIAEAEGKAYEVGRESLKKKLKQTETQLTNITIALIKIIELAEKREEYSSLFKKACGIAAAALERLEKNSNQIVYI